MKKNEDSTVFFLFCYYADLAYIHFNVKGKEMKIERENNEKSRINQSCRVAQLKREAVLQNSTFVKPQGTENALVAQSSKRQSTISGKRP